VDSRQWAVGGAVQQRLACGLSVVLLFGHTGDLEPGELVFFFDLD
jgi:hypothetical protein